MTVSAMANIRSSGLRMPITWMPDGTPLLSVPARMTPMGNR